MIANQEAKDVSNLLGPLRGTYKVHTLRGKKKKPTQEEDKIIISQEDKGIQGNENNTCESKDRKQLIKEDKYVFTVFK